MTQPCPAGGSITEPFLGYLDVILQDAPQSCLVLNITTPLDESDASRSTVGAELKAGEQLAGFSFELSAPRLSGA